MAGWAAAIQAAISLYGQHVSQGKLDSASRRMRNQSKRNPDEFFGPGGSGQFRRTADGSFVFTGEQDPLGILFRGGIADGGFDRLMGGLFNNDAFADAFNANDILESFAQAQAGTQQFMGENAFGNFGQHVQGLFNRGFSNLDRAADIEGLIQSNLDTSRTLAKPFEDRMRNDFFDSEFGSTLGATTGAGFRGMDFADAQFRADQNRILGAQRMGMEEQGLLSNLGMSQIGQGFAGESQGFQQALQSMGFNVNQGQNRLNNALGLFSLGRDTRQSEFAQGLAAEGALQGQNRFFLDMMLGLLGADNNRIGAQSGFAQAIAQLASNSSSSSSGFFGGMGSMFGNMDFGGGG